jgi:hypothetical protein
MIKDDPNLVAALKASSSILLFSLYGVRSSLERSLGLDNITINTDETVNKVIRRKRSEGEAIRYPYAYFSLSEITAVKDTQGNSKTTARVGLRTGTVGTTRHTVKKGYLFPITCTLALSILDGDPNECVYLSEALALLNHLGGLNFTLKVMGIDLNIRLEFPDTISFPQANTNASDEPGEIKLSTNLILHTWSGVFKDVFAVTDSKPIATFSVEGDIFSEVLP